MSYLRHAGLPTILVTRSLATRLAAIFFLVLMCLAPVAAEQPAAGSQDAPLTIVTWGDSITKGVRPGVKPEETFTAIAQRQLSEQGLTARVLNLGIGGETSGQALERIAAVIDQHPRWVTVMYGTNDSYCLCHTRHIR